ncbi:RNA-binding protein [Lyngbya sp. CCY1209]|jgi:RNA recognition motif-containing protein|uniref:RNA recognition motif domain-containing protein n=1 Tax=Lyngbya sp. CCY1209 TaxID=2886103 RepID=UPI002D2079A8|nr:RNA-binding protein [Lyngbya sp. CCY1209]MEB3885457.1 RNA-binding protein [Lyngbya sp. CCY1209]
MSIYVGNLSYDVTPDELSDAFSKYGTVKRTTIPTDRETGRSRGFGFVEMVNEEDENQAIEALDGSELMGRRIRVNKARPRENRDNQKRGGFQDA